MSKLKFFATVLILVAASGAVIAEQKSEGIFQDIVILDPGGPRLVWNFLLSGDELVRGAPNVLRDDFLVTPLPKKKEDRETAPQQRLICHTDKSGTTTVTRLQFVVVGSDGYGKLVEIADPGNEVGSALIVRIQGAILSTSCDHKTGCVNSGLPPELFGKLIPGSALFHDGMNWRPVTGTVKFDLVRSDVTSCT